MLPSRKCGEISHRIRLITRVPGLLKYCACVFRSSMWQLYPIQWPTEQFILGFIFHSILFLLKLPDRWPTNFFHHALILSIWLFPNVVAFYWPHRYIWCAKMYGPSFPVLCFLVVTTLHYDDIKWKHFPRYWPFVRGIHRSPVNSPHKDQWRGASIFFLICAWINGWINNSEAGDLRRHRAHYDVTVMSYCQVHSIHLNTVSLMDLLKLK